MQTDKRDLVINGVALVKERSWYFNITLKPLSLKAYNSFKIFLNSLDRGTILLECATYQRPWNR